MIKIELGDKPHELTQELQASLTKEYKTNGTSVWNRSFLKKAVLGFSNSKCCYTECKLNSESTYMEIDHFYPKKYYPDEVMEWGNLLPSSKKSNSTKGELNTRLLPIINPTIDDPKTHLYIKNFRFYPKTEIGRRTIDYTALNDRTHFVNKRFAICVAILEILENLREDLVDLIVDIKKNHRKLTRLHSKYKNLLEESSRKEEYSAIISTTILSDHNFEILNDKFAEIGFWDDELNDLIAELNFCNLGEDN